MRYMDDNEPEFVTERGQEFPPDKHATRIGETKYPFEDLQVSDTFKCRKSLSAVRQAIVRYGHRVGGEKRFTARVVEDGWVKVWRVK